jgi:SnoaL-like domain
VRTGSDAASVHLAGAPVVSPPASVIAALSGSSQAGWEVGPRETREIALVIAFIDAWNAGRVDDASNLLTENVEFSDCDYVRVKAVLLTGRDAVRKWLRARAADKDRLTVATVFNHNPDPLSGEGVIGVSYALRTSRTLASLGRPNGIKPQGASKVVFTDDDLSIRSFANGPGGGDQTLCQP